MIRLLYLTAVSAAALAFSAASSLHAQRSLRVRWPLVDFLVRADTGRPLMFVMSFSPSRERESVARQPHWVVFDPAETFQWTNMITGKLDSVRGSWRAAPGSIGPALRTRSGSRFLGLARQRDRWVLTLADSSGTKGYRATATTRELRELISGLGALAAWVARPGGPLPPQIEAEEPPCPAERQYLEQAPVDTEPAFAGVSTGQWRPSRELRRRDNARVWLQLLVDSLGRVDPAVTCVVLSDDTSFAAAALRSVSAIRARPAVRAGRRVDRLVLLEFSFEQIGY